jgi:hypothetical protein
MITSRCMQVCGVTTPVSVMNWFPSPCMCTTTGALMTGTQRAEQQRAVDENPAAR